jgi:hypothetical protein
MNGGGYGQCHSKEMEAGASPKRLPKSQRIVTAWGGSAADLRAFGPGTAPERLPQTH